MIYTSRGRSGFPHADPESVRDMPVPEAADLVRYVEALQAEVFATFPPTWRGPQDDLDLVQAMAEIATAISDRHPELAPEAVDAMVWVWGYSAWK